MAHLSRSVAAQVLGITDAADAQEIEAAFRRAISVNHPDAGGNDDQTRLIIEARVTLRALELPLEPSLAPVRSRTFFKRRRFR